VKKKKMKERETKEPEVSSPEPSAMQDEEPVEVPQVEELQRLNADLRDMNDKYLRLYAEFENYRKRVNKDKEELVKYGNENLLYELLPVIDNLELALQHALNDVSTGLVQGVEITLKELRKTLEKFGIAPIEALGRPFDPAVHHAMSQVERSDVDEMTVVEEYRKGYRLRDKVLRPSLVAVAKKAVSEPATESESEIITTIEEES